MEERGEEPHLAASEEDEMHGDMRAAVGDRIIVRGTRPGAARHLGPVAHAAVHHVGCPVAVVPHE